MNELSYTLQKIATLIEPTIIKGIFAAVLSLLFFMFGSLYTDALMAILMLMIIDTILGVAAVCKEDGVITSRRFSRVVIKGIIYFTSISAGYFADSTIPVAFVQGTMVAFVGITEFISILENIGRLGYQTPKRLLNDLREYRDSK